MAVDDRQPPSIWPFIPAALALLVCVTISAAPALAGTGGTSFRAEQAEPWHEEDENNGNDHHPERHGDHDGGLDGLLDNLADILDEVADLLRDPF